MEAPKRNPRVMSRRPMRRVLSMFQELWYRLGLRSMPYETTPEGDQFLRQFIIRWMTAHDFNVPAAATPTELLDAIADQAAKEARNEAYGRTTR